MRVISGKAKRIPLKTVEGMNTRPTTDRIKETLFNIINNEIYDSLFLDLFSGSGGIGIEALSRGARKAYFAENSRAAVLCIRENLKRTGLEGAAEVMETDVLRAVEMLDKNLKEAFDFIFIDPPYRQPILREVLKAIGISGIADEYTVIIVEEAIDTDFGYVQDLGFAIYRIKEYKTNKHIFLKKTAVHK